MLLWGVVYQGKTSDKLKLVEVLGSQLNAKMGKDRRMKGDAWEDRRRDAGVVPARHLPALRWAGVRTDAGDARTLQPSLQGLPRNQARPLPTISGAYLDGRPFGQPHRKSRWGGDEETG